MKFLLRVLIIVTFILLSLLGSAQAQQTTSTATAPYLSEFIPISELNNLKWAPAVAYSPQHHQYLVVWQNQWPGNKDIYGQRVSEHGELLSWFAISAGTNDRVDPAVAYDPVRDRYLVVWSYDYGGGDFDIRGRFVPWNGENLGNEIIISQTLNGEYHPQVAYGYTRDAFTVTWMSDNATNPSFIAARQVWAADGTFPGDAFRVSNMSADECDFPDIAYNLHRNEWLVVWDQWVGGDLDVYGVRMAGDGTVIGSGIFAIYATASQEQRPSVTSCHLLDQYLVVFEREYDDPPYDPDIWMRYVDGDGIPGASFEVGATTTSQLEPDVACNSAGNSYLIVWQDMWTDSYFGITAREAGSNGFPRSDYVIISSGTNENRIYPAVGGGSSQFLITWVHDISRAKAAYKDIYGRIYTPYVVFLPFLKN
jgi:hypothetical protein